MFLFLSLKHRRAGRTMNGLTYTQLARESWPTRRTRTQGSKATLSSPFHADGAWSHHRSLASTRTAVCTDLPDLVAPIRIPPARTRNFALYTRDLDDNITNYWQMSILVKKKSRAIYFQEKNEHYIFKRKNWNKFKQYFKETWHPQDEFDKFENIKIQFVLKYVPLL